MKTGIIRRVDDLGRVVIPREIRNNLGITVGSPLEISLEGNKLVFEKYIASANYADRVLDIIEAIKKDEDIGDEKEQTTEFLNKAYRLLINDGEISNGKRNM